MKSIISKLSLKLISIIKSINTLLSMFFHVFHLSFKIASIWVFHLPTSKLAIYKISLEGTFLLLPLPFAVGFVLLEMAVVGVAIGIAKQAIRRHPIQEDALKDTTLRISHDTTTMMAPLVVTLALVEGLWLLYVIVWLWIWRNLFRTQCPHYLLFLNYYSYP